MNGGEHVGNEQRAHTGLFELALFAGGGGGILGGKLLGWKTVCAVELDAYAASILVQRQNDGIFPPFPVWNDIRSFTSRNGQCRRAIRALRSIRGRLVVAGGFPCQDISAAGKGVGIDGERSGLWREMARVVREIRPRFVFVENSPMLTIRGLDRVLGDLASMGYDAEWGVFGADDAGAPHIGKRIWILAHAQRQGLEGQRPNARQPAEPELGDSSTLAYTTSEADRECYSTTMRGQAQQPGISYGPKNVADADEIRRNGRAWEFRARRRGKPENGGTEFPDDIGESSGRLAEPRRQCSAWLTEPGFRRVVNGFPARVDRIKACGNAQVPQVAALAWTILSQRINND